MTVCVFSPLFFQVCNGRWPTSATLAVIAFLREVRMGDALVETVVNRVLLRQLPCADLQDVPVIVYQVTDILVIEVVLLPTLYCI